MLDTAYALQALSAVNYNAGSVIPEAVGYLLSRQQAGGGFADGINDPSVFLTVNAFRALFPYRNIYAGVSAALTNAQNFLLAQRDGAGNFGEHFNTALALLALIPNVVDITPLNNSIGALQGAQLDNGSWGDDPYTTALALQALWLVTHRPPRTDVAVIQGSVIDAITRLPLAGVNVALTGPVSSTLTTGAAGAFRFPDLPFGSYTLAFTFNGYGALTTTTTAPNGQTFDLGALALTKNVDATTGTVRGTIKDAATSLPLSGVTVSVTGGLSAITSASGDYQIANVPPGSITATASLSGYSSASGTGSLVAGGTLVFSPALSPASAAGTVIQGQITAAATNQPLAGATVRINGVARATTDTNGNYRIADVTPGTLTLSVELAGYDTVTAVGEVAANTTTVFAPKLYATNTTPPGGNTAGVQGIVLDAGSGAPLAGVTIQTLFGGGTQYLTTGPDGHFSLTGLSATSGTLTFSLANYTSTSLSVTLAPLAILDVGEVRLRQSAASVLLPDLVVQTVDALQAINDPNTLSLGGTLTATVANVGTANTSGPVQVTAFYDANRNGAFDNGVDISLGRVESSQGLAVGATQILTVPLSGELPFRDAPISVWVDSGQVVAESNEQNNVGTTASACAALTGSSCVPPPAGMVGWWSGDNHSDDLMNKNPGTLSGGGAYAPGYVGQAFQFDGTSGVVRISETNANLDGFSQLTIDAWINPTTTADGRAIVSKYDSTTNGVGYYLVVENGVLRFAVFEKLWSVEPGPSSCFSAVPDLKAAGVESGAGVIQANTWTHVTGVWAGGSNLKLYKNGVEIPGTVGVVGGFQSMSDNKTPVNIGRIEKTSCGNHGSPAFFFSGLIDEVEIFNRALTPGEIQAIYDAGTAGKCKTPVAPDPVDLTASRLQMIDRGPGQGVDLSLRVGNVGSSSGPVSWWPGETNTDDIADSNPGILEGPVTYVPGKVGQAFQFNGSSQMRVPNASNLRVSRGEFTVEAWVRFDALRGSVSTANGDMSIFDTITGGINVDGWRLIKQSDNRFWFCFGAGSNHCYDPAYTVFSATRATTGVFYHVAAVKTATHFEIYVNGNREDARALPPSFVDSQTSDLLIGGNAVEGAHLIGLIDEPKIYNRALTAAEIQAIYNGASVPGSSTEVAFYDGDPAAGGALLGSTVVNAIPANGYRDIVFNTAAPLSGRDIYAVVDPNNRISECRENNNSVHVPVATAARGAVTASTDKGAYGPNSPVILQGLALNTGTLTATYSIELQVEDQGGVSVQGFAPQTVANLVSGYTATVTNNWNTGTLLAGNYRLRAILRDMQGRLLAQHTVGFTIGINAPNCGQPTVNMLVTPASIPGNDPAHLTPVLRFKFEGTGPLTALSSIPSYPESLVNDPIYAAFSPQNELFISNRHGNVRGAPASIARFKFDADGNFLANGAVTGNSLEAVHGIAFSPSGELFAANLLSGMISRFKFDSAGNAIPNGTFYSGTPHSQGLAFSPNGELFVTDSGNNNAPYVQRWRFDQVTGNPVYNGTLQIPGALSTHGIGFDSKGELFIADLGNQRVYRFKFDSAGNPVSSGSFAVRDAIGIAFSPAGELFVTSHGSGGINRFLFDQNGNVVPNGVIPTPTLGGLAIKPILRGAADTSCIAPVTTKVTTDKQVYEAWDTVNISGRVQNAASNALLAPTRVELTVRSPAGQALFFEARDLGQLTPQALRDLSYTMPLVDAVTGSYPVELVLKDAATGDVLSTAATSFQVNRREIQALTGTVNVANSPVYQGDANRCTETAKNVSSTAIFGVRLIHQLINADVGTVVNEVTETVDLAAGGVVHNYFRDIDTASLAIGNYSCVIKAELNGDVKTLAFGGFQVLEPPIKISASLALGSRGRLLVLLDNARCEVKEGGNGNGVQSGHCDNDPNGPTEAPALSTQRAFLESLLKGAGWSYTVAETADDFTREFYSGGYTAYALFSEREKLAEDTQKALREAVLRGEGLFVAGAHDARNLHTLRIQEALGIKHIGHVSHAAGMQLTDSPLALTGIFDLFLGDKALRIRRVTASSAATYLLGGPAHDEGDPEDCSDSSRRYEEGRTSKDKDEHDECEGHPERYLDALTLNTYGNGKSALAGVDLLATATRDGEQSLAAQLLLRALSHIHPATIYATPRGVIPIALTLVNQGIATSVRATVTLPQGVAVVDPTAASIQNNALVWDTTLAVNETKTLTFYLRLPDTAGAVTLYAQVAAPKAGTYSLVAEPSITINVETPSDVATIRQMIEAVLSQLPKPQANALREALERLQHAESYLGTNPSKVLHESLKAADALTGDVSAEIFPIRLEIARWVRVMAQRIGGD